MKSNFILLLLVTLSAICGTAQQIEWEKTDSPFRRGFRDSPFDLGENTIAMTSDGLICGALSAEPDDLFTYSNDRGMTWESIPLEEKFDFVPSILIRKDRVFLQVSQLRYNKLFEFDRATSRLNEIEYPEEFDDELSNFNILANNNIVAKANDSIFLLNPDWSIIDKRAMDISGSAIVTGNNDLNYIIERSSTSALIEFSDDFSYFSDPRPMPDGTMGYVKLVNDTLYIDSQYSPDGGLNWIDIGFFGKYVDDNGVIYSPAFNDRMWVSSVEQGSDFESFRMDFDFGPQELRILGIFGNEIYMVERNACAQLMTLHHLVDYKASSPPISLRIGTPLIEDISAYSYDEYNVELCDENYSRVTRNNNWNEFIRPASNEELSRMKYTPSGEIYGYADNTLVYSSDQGESWQFVASTGSNIEIKSEFTYSLGADEVLIKIDRSNNIVLEANYPDSVWTEHILFDNRLIGKLTTSEVLVTYNYVTDQLEILSYGNPGVEYDICHIETSWDERRIYLSVYNEDLDRNEIHISSDGGQTWEVKLVGLDLRCNYIFEVDRLGNFYFFSEDEDIFFSNDQSDTWQDISPEDPQNMLVTDVDLSYDNYIFISSYGGGIYKSTLPLEASKLNVKLFVDENGNCQKDPLEEEMVFGAIELEGESTLNICLLYTSPSPRDRG